MVKQFRHIILLLLSGLLIACSHQQHSNTISHTESLALFAEKILSIDTLIQDQQFEKAQQQQNKLKIHPEQFEYLALQRYSQAHLAFAQQNYTVSQSQLNHPSLEEYLDRYTDENAQRIYLLQAQLHEKNEQILSAIRLRIYLADLLTEDDTYKENHDKVWSLLNSLTDTGAQPAVSASETILKEWLNLLFLFKTGTVSLDQQLALITQWFNNNPKHPAALMPPAEISALIEAINSRPKKIAVILPFEGKYRHHGAAIRDGIIHSWYRSNYQPELTFYSFNDTDNFTNVYQEALFDGADMVIGPLFKNQVEELYHSDYALPVPTIALNRLDKNGKQLPPLNLYEYSLSSEDEIDSLIKLALAQKKDSALIIYQNEPWAIKAAQYFQDQWQAGGQSIIASTSFTHTHEQSQLLQQALQTDRSQQRARELQWLTGLKLQSEPRARKDIDMIFLVSRPEAAASLRPLLSFHYAGDIPVYANSSVYRGYPNPAIDNDLNSIYFSDTPLSIAANENVHAHYQNTPYVRVFAMGIDSFMLAERIALLKDKPSIKLQGVTGELWLDNNTIKRQTPFAQFYRGQLQQVFIPESMPEKDTIGD